MTILDFSHELLYDKSREAELMDILGIESMDEVSIIPWRPPTTPPQDKSYVFAKFHGPLSDLIETGLFDYQDGDYTLATGKGYPYRLCPDDVLGWAYPITYRK